MKNVNKTFSGIMVGALLAIGCIGLLWVNGETNVGNVKVVTYNAVPTLK